MTEQDSIVITGAAVVCSLGLDRDSVWNAVVEGRCGVGPLTAVESVLTPDKGGGQAPDLPDEHGDPEAREVAYLKYTIRAALEDAFGPDGSSLPAGAVSRGRERFTLPYPADRSGFVLGTTLHGMRCGGRFLRTGDYTHLRGFLAGSTLHRATASFEMDGLAMTTCSACSSGLSSIALGVTLLQDGQLDLVLAGGYDPISEYAYAGFNSLRLIAEGPMRPFAKDREGMKIGEAYGVVVLERATDAARRGARVFARIAGYGEACDAHHLTKPHPHGEGAATAIESALESAGIDPREIDLIATHSTSTLDNDAAEFAALSRVFGNELARKHVVAFKSHLGHGLGGAGAVELILAGMALRHQVVPPCANVTEEMVEFPGLRLSTGAPTRTTIRHAMHTSLGFGGSNVCVIIGPGSDPVHDARNRATDRSAVVQAAKRAISLNTDRDVLITGIGVVLPGSVGNEAFLRSFTSDDQDADYAVADRIEQSEIEHLLSARRVRRMSDYAKLTLAATVVAYDDARIEDAGEFGGTCAAVLGTTHGSSGYCRSYYGQIVEEGVDAANPMLFAEGVPNVGGAHLSTAFSLRGQCQTIIGTRTAGLDALRLAALRIKTGSWERALVSAGDEFCESVAGAYRHFGLHAEDGPGRPFEKPTGFVMGCGAVTFVLESRASAVRRGARSRGVVRDCTSAAPRSIASKRGAELAGGVLTNLRLSEFIVSSANGTWIDRVEAAAIRRCGDQSAPSVSGEGATNGHERRAQGEPDGAARRPTVSSLCGHIAECFSALPMAAIAYVLLTGRLPALRGTAPRGSKPALGCERPESFGVMATDYYGTMAGARIDVVDRSEAMP